MTQTITKISPSKYIIYCDLDGVLVDFDKGYYDLTDVLTHHADRQGKDEFWDLFRNKLKEKNITEKQYWESLQWMSDGKILWDYIKKYNPYVLTAPSINHNIPKPERYNISHNESIQGKVEWVKRLDGMKKIYFAAASFKQQYASKNKILIDDRLDTIERWINKGGIGIYHTSAQNTINELKKLEI
jgi:hypothetical protein